MTKKKKYALKIIILLLTLSAITNFVMLKIEENEIKPNGKLVEVNDNHIHVYSEGPKSDKPTFVFMSGSATVAPVYDFKTLYTKLSDEYHIVVIEKFGYGYSDITNSNRDVAAMLEETRQALKLAGEQGSYVLLPHSMSGIEALYWAQQYPDEVEGIIGLDMALPTHYDDFNFTKARVLFAIGNVMKYLGLGRVFEFIYPLSTLNLNDEEIIQQKYLLRKNMLNRMYYKEVLL